jgi:hypothetical protein
LKLCVDFLNIFFEVIFILLFFKSNVEGIMNSEENTIKLIAMLDKAVEDIEKIDQRLQIYEDKICVCDKIYIFYSKYFTVFVIGCR